VVQNFTGLPHPGKVLDFFTVWKILKFCL